MENQRTDALLPLAFPEQPNPPPRPTDRDDRVRVAAVAAILPEVAEWLGDEYGGTPRDQIVADLLSVVGETDGYRACRKLERDHRWQPDEHLVDILAGLPSTLLGAERAFVKLWAEANGVRPHLTIGEVVDTPAGSGPITSIAGAIASYVVQTDEYLRRNPDQNGGVLIPYEQCTPAAAEAKAA
jgi:hypothetical protein